MKMRTHKLFTVYNHFKYNANNDETRVYPPIALLLLLSFHLNVTNVTIPNETLKSAHCLQRSQCRARRTFEISSIPPRVFSIFSALCTIAGYSSRTSFLFVIFISVILYQRINQAVQTVTTGHNNISGKKYEKITW